MLICLIVLVYAIIVIFIMVNFSCWLCVPFHIFSNFIYVFIYFCSKDIANFHRPKALWYPHDIEMAVKEQGKLPTQGPMKIILKSLGGKGSKLHVDAEETVSSVKLKASKKLG